MTKRKKAPDDGRGRWACTSCGKPTSHRTELAELVCEECDRRMTREAERLAKRLEKMLAKRMAKVLKTGDGLRLLEAMGVKPEELR